MPGRDRLEGWRASGTGREGGNAVPVRCRGGVARRVGSGGVASVTIPAAEFAARGGCRGDAAQRTARIRSRWERVDTLLRESFEDGSIESQIVRMAVPFSFRRRSPHGALSSSRPDNAVVAFRAGFNGEDVASERPITIT